MGRVGSKPGPAVSITSRTDEAPPRLLHEMADVLARHQERRPREEAAARHRADELLALLDTPHTQPQAQAQP
ncbi:hypothetical protein [Streptomyces sp. KL118A]|uniref:hypothetical protein n=1 Tax=Streptomyces sp. KL118A TaxID=3045153 RepID=UPI00278C85DC|nr:hypothetical protein [Streptomyces sp. KL118A]